MAVHPKRIENPVMYLASLRGGNGPKLLLIECWGCVMKDRVFQPSLARMGILMRRHPRTISRWESASASAGSSRRVGRK